jgi:prevent-host-death family protein
MSIITATDAKNKFGQVLEEAQREPVRIQKSGRDVAVLISAAEYERLKDAGSEPRINPRIEALHQRSIAKWDKVYKELAK